MADAPDNMFVKISDIPGDATEKMHIGWIAVNSVSWSVNRAVESDLGSSQRGHANAVFNKVELKSALGLAASRLMASVANGTVRPMIEIHLCRAGDATDLGLEPYLIFKLMNVMVVKYDVGGSADGVPDETWELAYRQIDIEYKATDPATNALATKGTFKWNLETGKFE